MSGACHDVASLALQPHAGGLTIMLRIEGGPDVAVHLRAGAAHAFLRATYAAVLHGRPAALAFGERDRSALVVGAP